ncbi:diacylglycerol/polyprenol kinase family protein [Patescibacteria group bacterium]
MSDKKGLIWEFLRKFVHLSSILIVVVYTLFLNYFSEDFAILALTALLLILLEVEYFRLEHRSWLVDKIAPIFRKHEKDQVAGNVFLVISCIICFAAFEYWIAVVALFMTVFGDLFAALVGKAWGTTKMFKSKTYVGTLAGLAANLIVGILILPDFLYIVIPMAITASFVETITNKLDDNLTVPLFAGFIGQLFIYYQVFYLGKENILPPIDFTFLGLF